MIVDFIEYILAAGKEALMAISPVGSIFLLALSGVGAISIGWFVSTKGMRLLYRLIDYILDKKES